MEIIERISLLLTEREKTAYDLCKIIGVQQSTMSTWRSRKKNPPAELLPDIARYLGVSLDYLLTGEENSSFCKLEAGEGELLDLFRALPQNKKYEFIGELKGFLRAVSDSRRYADENKKII